jgi:type IV pilus assembly protein PilW
MASPKESTQRGVTLVELLVALTVSLVLVLAAIAIYSTTSSSQRTLDEVNAANEAGTFALRALGRDLANAGFYPAVRTENPGGQNATPTYKQALELTTTNTTLRANYGAGVFGCEGAQFNPSTASCGTTVPGDPDSLAIGYFTSDAFGTLIGQRGDCEGNDVASATANLSRRGSPPAGQPPASPIFGVNAYQLTAAQNTTVNGRTTTTRSLACAGNGDNNTTYSNLVAGIEDLQLSYAVMDSDSRVPERYLTASQVNTLGDLVVDGITYSRWDRVTAARVCVIARTYQTSAALSPSDAPPTYTNCDGDRVSNPSGDTSVKKTYIQVFGLRNRQGWTY